METWLPIRPDRAGHLPERRAVYLSAGTGERPVGEFLADGGLVVGAGLIGWPVSRCGVAKRLPIEVLCMIVVS